MPINEKRPWLLSYDIANPRRLVRIHRLVSESGLSLQYSVFYFFSSAREMRGLKEVLRRKIDPRRDDIRIYPLPRRIQVDTLGKAPVAEGVLLYGLSLPAGFMGRVEKREKAPVAAVG
jgi:CRISPR-associated protein Cas2